MSILKDIYPSRRRNGTALDGPRYFYHTLSQVTLHKNHAGHRIMQVPRIRRAINPKRLSKYPPPVQNLEVKLAIRRQRWEEEEKQALAIEEEE